VLIPETVREYEGYVCKEPKLRFERRYVLTFTPYTYYNVDVNQALREVETLLKNLPQQNYQLFVVNTQLPYLKLRRTENKRKNEIIEVFEREINRKVAFRKLGFYLCFDEKVELVKSQLKAVFRDVREGKEELFSQLATLFGGVKEEPFFYPLKRTELGFKIEGKDEKN